MVADSKDNTFLMVFWVWEQTFFDVGGKNTQTDRFVWIREHIFFVEIESLFLFLLSLYQKADKFVSKLVGHETTS